MGSTISNIKESTANQKTTHQTLMQLRCGVYSGMYPSCWVKMFLGMMCIGTANMACANSCILFSLTISSEATYYLVEMIQHHLQHFPTLYPYAKIRPKQHFLIYYPRCMHLLGPIFRFWEM